MTQEIEPQIPRLNPISHNWKMIKHFFINLSQIYKWKLEELIMNLISLTILFEGSFKLLQNYTFKYNILKIY